MTGEMDFTARKSFPFLSIAPQKTTPLLNEKKFSLSLTALDLTVLRPRVTAWAFGIPMDIPIPQEDGCETLISGNCPLRSGDNATYTFTMSVSKEDYYPYAGIYASIEFAFLDEYDNVTICVQMPAMIEL